MAPDYVQHNPNIPPGRDGFKKFMSRFRKPEPIQKEWKRTPTLIMVAGPYVLFMTDVQAKDPADPTKAYTRDHFDMVRVDKGMVREHWDEARKNPPRPAGNRAQ
jgi:predicted SnoaL-like aldol condensation-catalyzing enzyme